MNTLNFMIDKSILTFISCITLVTLSGCASTSSITPDYVSSSNYNGYNCQQLSQEYSRINGYTKQAQKPAFDLSSTGVNIGLSGNKNGIYPTISLGTNLGNANRKNQARNTQLAKLYGERDAVIQSARSKSCPFANGLKLHGE